MGKTLKPVHWFLLLAILGGILMAIILGSSLFLSQQSQDTRNQAATQQRVTRTREFVIPKMTAQCGFGQDGNLDQRDKHSQARKSSAQGFRIPENCTAKNLVVTAPRPNRQYMYDDTFWLLIDNNIVAGWKQLLDDTDLNIGQPFDWQAIRGKPTTHYSQEGRGADVVCYGGGRCLVPFSNEDINGSIGRIRMEFGPGVLNQVLTGENPHRATVVITGDNDPETDCQIHSDLTFKLEMECVQMVPECRDGIDNDEDGKTDCTPGAEDPGCYPNGRGGGGECNPDDDNEEDSTPDWISNAECQASFSLTDPVASPVASPMASPDPAASPVASPVASPNASPTADACFVIEAFHDEDGDGTRDSGEDGLDWDFDWERNDDNNMREYLTYASQNGRGGNVCDLEDEDRIHIHQNGRGGWVPTTGGDDRTITVQDGRNTLVVYGFWQPPSSPVAGSSPQASPKASPRASTAPKGGAVASPTPEALPVSGSETPLVIMTMIGMAFIGLGFYRIWKMK